MRKLTVERIEGIYVFCADDEKKLYAIEQNELPSDIAAGNCLTIDDEGTVTVSKEKPAPDRRKRR